MKGEWEHFAHDADMGVRGYGATREEAFEQAAVASTAIITAPAAMRQRTSVAEALRTVGQPVLIGGSMGTGSYILRGGEGRKGSKAGKERAFASACHGGGRAMSHELAERGILIRSPSQRGVAEEAPGAYKDVGAVVDAAEAADVARKLARMTPLICVKG